MEYIMYNRARNTEHAEAVAGILKGFVTHANMGSYIKMSDMQIYLAYDVRNEKITVHASYARTEEYKKLYGSAPSLTCGSISMGMGRAPSAVAAEINRRFDSEYLKTRTAELDKLVDERSSQVPALLADINRLREVCGRAPLKELVDSYRENELSFQLPNRAYLSLEVNGLTGATRIVSTSAFNASDMAKILTTLGAMSELTN